MDEQAKNLNQALLAAMDTYSRRTCFHLKRGKRLRAVSFQRFQTLAFRLTNFFHSHGIASGQRIAIIADNPLEWMVVYVASLLAGGVVVPLRAWLPSEMLHAMVKDSGACLAVVQGERQRWLIESARQDLPECETVLVVNEIDSPYPWVLSVPAILAKTTTSAEDEAIRIRAERVHSDNLASIFYKTGWPHGVVFSHAQRLAAVRSMADWFALNEDDVAITTILTWSLASIDAALYYFLSGIPHVVTESNEMTFSRQTSPTVIMTTPSGFEEFYNNIMTEIQELPSARQALFQGALTVGKEYRQAGPAASQELRDAYARADLTFFSPIRARSGGRLYRIYSTGAPLPQLWAEFAEIIGTLPLNVYSLTEAGGFPAVSRPAEHRPDSCGQVAPGFQIRIADDGEVLVRGPAVMQGYWQQPEETRQVLYDDGWLRTGDLGRFDQDGYLYLIGHKQPQIVLSIGRNVTPGVLENALTASPYVAQAVVFGEGRPYISALIAPDLPAVIGYLRENGSSDEAPMTANHPQVVALIAAAVNEVNHRLDSWTQINQYHLLDEPLCEQAGELTSSQKPCREVVVERYAQEIEAMYPRPIQFEQKDVSQVQLELDELRELLEKQDILDAWLQDAGIGFLFELAREMQIDAPSMVHICETVAAIAQAQSEEKPLSTALVVGDPATISSHLHESEIQLQRFDHIRRMRQIIINLAKMVDGLVLAYLVDKHGYLRGIYKLGDKTPEEAENFLLGPQFRYHAALSRGCEAVVFFVPAGGRQARVFADGQLIGRYANGSWSAESIPQIDETLARLAEQRECNLALLQRILRCAFQMSEDNLGAIFLVGDANTIMENSDPPEISTFASIVETALDRLTDRELINFAKQDGATVIDTQGRLKGCMVLLRPGANTKAEIGPGKGARHSSAAKMSTEAKCLAITISQDGPITVYDSGQRVLSI